MTEGNEMTARRGKAIAANVALVCIAIGAAPVAARQGHADATMATRSPAIAELVGSVSAERLQEYLTRLVGFGTRHTMSDTTSTTRGIGAARRYIHGMFEQFSRACGGCLTVSYDPHDVVITRHPERPTWRVVNVMALLRGRTDPTRLIVVTGHYDSCICSIDNMDATSDAPGANDDGSGTVAVLELARVFSEKFPQGLDASVLFVPVAGEEMGLLGSTALAARLAREGEYAIEAALTNDIAGNVRDSEGRVDSTSVRVFAPEPDDGPSRQLARLVESVAELYTPGLDVRVIERLDRIGRGGDHRPFWEQGLAAVRVSESHENFGRQHRPEDTIDGVHFPYVEKVTRLNAAAIAELGLAPGPPADLRMRRVRGGGDSDYQLTWSAVENAPDLAGYEVTVRRTTDHMPMRVIPVGNVTTYVLQDTQADDLWIGVRAVDRDGHRSLIRSFHAPERLPAGGR